jgi:hypothetical protein
MSVMTSRLFVVAGILLMVVVLGVVDYLTGDYSLVIFYLIPISLAAWFCGRGNGLLVAACSGVTRVASDFALHGAGENSALHYWNFSVEAFLFVIVATLVAVLNKSMAKDDDH